MRFSLEQIAEATNGRVVDPDHAQVEITGASTDSRTVEPSVLFVPIVAERDGHDFVARALADGAAAHLTATDVVEGPAVRVSDTTVGLQQLGLAARRRMHGPVIGITGSVGKTTTKDLTEAALAGSLRTHASYKSFNNELGVPLTLVNAPDDVQVVVVEMGARGAGHIEQLCGIAEPTIGVVLAVGAAHTELFGDVAGVAAAKGELVEALPEDDGVAVLNADDPLVAAMASRTAADVLFFGANGDVRAEGVTLDGELRPSFSIVSPWGTAETRLASRGVHTVSNALAATAAAMSAGADLEAVAHGLGQATMSPWRMEVDKTPAGAVVINDAYNANPLSMHAAIDSLLALPAQRRIAVLGVMAELGPEAAEEHRRVGDRAAAEGIDVIAVDVPEYAGTQTASSSEALEALRTMNPGEGDVILLKGSRVAGLEALAAELLFP